MTDPTPRRFAPRGRNALIAGALGLLAVGGGAGAIAVSSTRPSVTMAPAVPVAIRSLADSGIVTIRGRVAEIYGNTFIMADASGRALVETGRAGESGTLVAVGQPVTVQGRFAHGVVHAAFLVSPNGKVAALGPLGGPPHSDRGPHGHGPGGPGPDRGGPDHGGPDRGRDAGPDGAAPPPPAAAQPGA